jgi:hypothetical protein
MCHTACPEMNNHCEDLSVHRIEHKLGHWRQLPVIGSFVRAIEHRHHQLDLRGRLLDAAVTRSRDE